MTEPPPSTEPEHPRVDYSSSVLEGRNDSISFEYLRRTTRIAAIQLRGRLGSQNSTGTTGEELRTQLNELRDMVLFLTHLLFDDPMHAANEREFLASNNEAYARMLEDKRGKITDYYANVAHAYAQRLIDRYYNASNNYEGPFNAFDYTEPPALSQSAAAAERDAYLARVLADYQEGTIG